MLLDDNAASVAVKDPPTFVVLSGGEQGLPGIPGLPGASGGAWLFLGHDPLPTEGQDGQTAFNTTNGKVFQKAAGAWALQGTVTGQAFYYEHVQNTAADTWVVNHNLGKRPNVSVYTLGGLEVDAEVLHVSENQVQVFFDLPATGIATFS